MEVAPRYAVSSGVRPVRRQGPAGGRRTIWAKQSMEEVLVPDQLATSIAIVLATKGAEALAAGSRDAIAALYRTVSHRLGRRRADAEVLDAAVAHPEQSSRQRELANVLARTMAEDPAFAEVMIARWRAAQGEVSVSRNGVLNQFSGQAEKIVQARDITGNVTL